MKKSCSLVFVIILGLCNFLFSQGTGAPTGAARTTAAAKAPGSVELYFTAKDTGDRLEVKGSLSLAGLAQPGEDSPAILIDPGKKFQTIEGIGGAITDTAAETFCKLPAQSIATILL